MALMQAAQALAALRGRTYVLPDDVKYLVRPGSGPSALIPENRRTAPGTNRRRVFLKDLIAEIPVPGPDAVSEPPAAGP